VLQYLTKKNAELTVLLLSGVFVVLSSTVARIIILFHLRVFISVVAIFILISVVIS
jgi:hypothetical protein